MLRPERTLCAPKRRSTRRPCKPRLESLETRCVPTTVFKWNGSQDEFWGNANNWDDLPGPLNVAPSGSGGEVLVFPTGGSHKDTKIDLGANAQFDRIEILGGGYSFDPKDTTHQIQIPTGKTLQLIQMTPNASSAFRIPLVVNGTVDFDIYPDTTMAVAAPISGAGKVVKQLDGTLEFSGGNTYAGATDLQGGILRKQGSESVIPDNGPVMMSPGALLDLTNATEYIGSLSGAGQVWLGTGSLVTGLDNSNTTYAGVISGVGGAVAKRGTGVWTLTGGNSFTRGMYIDQGTLRLGADGVLHDTMPVGMLANTVLDMTDRTEYIGSLSGSGQVSLGTGSLVTGLDNSNTTYAGVISGVGGAVAKRGTGVWTLTGANSFTRGMYIDEGTLRLGADGVLHDTMPVGMLANTILDMTDRTEYIGSLSGAGQVWLGTGSLVTGLDNSNTTYAGVISGVGGAVAKRGTGVWTLTGANSFTRGMYIDQGTLKLGADGVLHDTMPVGMLANTILDMTDRTEYIGSLSGAGQVWLGTGSLITGMDNSNTTYAGVISGPSGSLSKRGTGVMTLTGANTYGRATYIDAGTLKLGANHVLADDAPVNMATNTILDMTDRIEFIGSLEGSGQVLLDNGSLMAGQNNASTTYAGVISGGGAIVKAGTGVLTLTGQNSFNGGIYDMGGTLLINGSFADSMAYVNGGSTFGGTGTVGAVTVYPGAVLDPGVAVGTLQTGNLTFNGPLSVLRAQLDGSAAASYDRLRINGIVKLGGSKLDAQLGFVPAVGDGFTIIENDGTDPIDGTFDGLPEGALFTKNGKPYEITYEGGDGNDVVLTRIAAAIVISPLTTLVTTETGSTATFSVALGSVPTADVTVALSSSDASEGTISPTTLTFTPANALTPQTVTVTGVSDTEADGNITFNIVTAAAVSSDPEYSGLNPADVPVINLDLLSKGTRKFADADGDTYTVRLTGPGTVAVRTMAPDGNGPGAIERIVVAGTDPLKSRLSVTVKKGPTGNGEVDLSFVEGSGLRGISARSSDLIANGVQLDGPLGGLTVRDISSRVHVRAVGSAAFKTTFRARIIGHMVVIDLDNPISSFIAAHVGESRIEAPAIGSLLVTGNKALGVAGDFEADVQLSGLGVLPGKSALGTAYIRGSVIGSSIEVLSGNVGSFKAGRFVDSHLHVGFAPTNTNDPMAGGTFVPDSKIGSFRVTGYTGLTTPAFADSTIAAAIVGSVSLKSVQTANGGNKFGILADTQVGSVYVTAPSYKYLKGQPSGGIDDFEVKIV